MSGRWLVHVVVMAPRRFSPVPMPPPARPQFSADLNCRICLTRTRRMRALLNQLELFTEFVFHLQDNYEEKLVSLLTVFDWI